MPLICSLFCFSRESKESLAYFACSSASATNVSCDSAVKDTLFLIAAVVWANLAFNLIRAFSMSLVAF